MDYTEKAFACLPELQRDESLIKRWEKLRIGYFTLFKTKDETQYYGRLYPGGILFPKDQLQQVIAGKTSLISIIYELTSKMSVVFAPHVTLMRKVPVTRWSWRRRASKESPDQIPILRLT